MKRTNVIGAGLLVVLGIFAVGPFLKWLRDKPVNPKPLPSLVLDVSLLPQNASLNQRSLSPQPTILESAPEEESLGPQSFDVFKDSFVLADTASNRLLIISPTRRVEQIRLPFSPERVLSQDDAGKVFLVRNGSTGETFRVERDGSLKRAEETWETLFPFENFELSRLLTSNRGEIQFRSAASASGSVPVQFQFQESGSHLETIRSLGSEGRFVYAFVETVSDGVANGSHSSVLKLLGSGAVKCIIPLPTDGSYAYVEDFIRVKSGVVYELALKHDSLEIRQWDTN